MMRDLGVNTVKGAYCTLPRKPGPHPTPAGKAPCRRPIPFRVAAVTRQIGRVHPPSQGVQPGNMVIQHKVAPGLRHVPDRTSESTASDWS